MIKAASFKIAEQPASNLLRFRYKKDGSHGSLIGESSTSDRKTFPAIKIENYTGMVSVQVSCVTKNAPYKSHPNDLVGDNCKEGVCYFDACISETSSVLHFPRLGIRREKINGIKEKLKKRRLDRIDPFGRGFKHIKELRKGLQCVRLCFEVSIRDPMNPTHKIRLLPKVTKPIYNTEFPAVLKIYRISDTSSPKCGEKNIVILCNKISENDISVQFFQKSGENVIWKDQGTRLYIHRNVGISFMTPIYEHQGQDRHIDVVENVFVQLVRPSDNVRSKAIPFHYVTSTSAQHQQYFRHYPHSEQQQHQIFREINVPQHQPVQYLVQQQQLPQPFQNQEQLTYGIPENNSLLLENNLLLSEINELLIENNELFVENNIPQEHFSQRQQPVQHQAVQHQPVQQQPNEIDPIEDSEPQQQLPYEMQFFTENHLFQKLLEVLHPSTMKEILQLPLLANAN